MKKHRVFTRSELPLAKKYRSDLFKCSSCGRAIHIKVLGDTCTCSACGGTMYRQ